MSDLSLSERQSVRKAIDAPQAVLMVRLKHVTTANSRNNDDDRNEGSELAVANLHVTWSQLKYPALQALQVCLFYFRVSKANYFYVSIVIMICFICNLSVFCNGVSIRYFHVLDLFATDVNNKAFKFLQYCRNPVSMCDLHITIFIITTA